MNVEAATESRSNGLTFRLFLNFHMHILIYKEVLIDSTFF